MKNRARNVAQFLLAGVPSGGYFPLMLRVRVSFRCRPPGSAKSKSVRREEYDFPGWADVGRWIAATISQTGADVLHQLHSIEVRRVDD